MASSWIPSLLLALTLAYREVGQCWSHQDTPPFIVAVSPASGLACSSREGRAWLCPMWLSAACQENSNHCPNKPWSLDGTTRFMGLWTLWGSHSSSART